MAERFPPLLRRLRVGSRSRRRPGPPQPPNSAEVAAYYDDWTDRYLEGFGDVFQTFRSVDPRDFLERLGRTAGLSPGQRVLDAGCGVGGPARFFADRFGVEVDGVTISQRQVDLANQPGDSGSPHPRVHVIQGDFHRLHEIYPPDTFDVVYFLEAFTHTNRPDLVAESVFRVLKPGGSIFIKDLYRARGNNDDEERGIDAAVRNTNNEFRLFVRPRQVVTDALAAAGFEIELDEPFELYEDFDYDTGNRFVETHGIPIWDGPFVIYLEHAQTRGRKPPGG